MSAALPSSDAGGFPSLLADRCVKCGLCLPHCPTYGATLDEGDSPRGRIALMQALATGQLQAEARLEAHLDGCLTCRACEAVCPADVPYGQLIDASRAMLAELRPRRAWVARILAAVMSRPWLRTLVAALVIAYQRSGLQGLVRRSGLLGRSRLARLESLLPRVHLPRWPEAAGRGAEKVALFTGCTSPLVEPQTLDAAVTLLARLGCGITVPADQGCCGALHQHAGHPDVARRCAERNLDAFLGADAVVGVASGCTAQLAEYDLLVEGDAAAAFAARACDLHRFLAEHPRRARLRFRPLAARIALHAPCSLRNVLKGERFVRALLADVPGLEIVPLESGCCGAAGSYFLSEGAMADRLLTPLVDAVARAAPDYVLSANAGCAMHLAAGLRRAGLSVPVWHPARLLAQQLEAP